MVQFKLQRGTKGIPHGAVEFGREEAILAMETFKELAGTRSLSGGNVRLSDGGALAPDLAAACLHDLARTQVFLNGAIEAVRDKLDQTHENVHFVEFGSGPFAPFAHFLALAIPDERLKIGYVDFFAENIRLATRISEGLGVKDRVFHSGVADLLTAFFRGLKVDVAFLEVMGPTLLYEPQAPVTFNLARDLPKDLCFLPNRVTVSAQLGSVDLGELVSVDDTFRSRAKEQGFSARRSLLEVDRTFLIPDDVDRVQPLSLETAVHVYGDWKLAPRTSLITRSHFLNPHLDPQIDRMRIAYRLSGSKVEVDFLETKPAARTL